MEVKAYRRIRKLVQSLGLLGTLILAWSLLLFEPSTVSAQSNSDRAVINQDLTIEKGDVVENDVSVTNGNLTVLGEVRNDVVVFQGNARIEGKVDGDIAVTNGNLELGPASVVEGDVLVLGGKVIRDKSAQVSGSVNAPSFSLEGLGNAVVDPGEQESSGEFAPSTPYGEVFGNLLLLFSKGMISLILLVLGMLLVAVVPTRVSLSSATLEAAPVPSLIVGLITSFLFFPVVGIISFVLFISIVGMLFLPVLAVVVLGALLFGLVAVSTWVGKSVYDSIHSGNPVSSQQQLFIHVLLGMSIVLGTTLLPSVLLPGSVGALMFILLYFASCVGIGSAILSRFGTLVPPKHSHSHYQYPTHSVPPSYGIVSSGFPPTSRSPVEGQPATPSEPKSSPPVGHN